MGHWSGFGEIERALTKVNHVSVISPEYQGAIARDLVSSREFTVAADESLLAAIEKIESRSGLIGCRNGGCGVCRVQIFGGRVRLGRMSRRFVSIDAERERFALACRVFVDERIEFKAAPVGSRSSQHEMRNTENA